MMVKHGKYRNTCAANSVNVAENGLVGNFQFLEP